MKNCRKCKQSFFDEVEDCVCGSKKFVYTVPPVIEPAISKNKYDDDDDLMAEQDYEKKAEEVLRQKWGQSIKPFRGISNPLISGKASIPISTQPTSRSVLAFTPQSNPSQLNPFTNKTMTFPLSKNEADQFYRSAQSKIQQKSFQQFKRDQLLKRHKEESKDDE